MAAELQKAVQEIESQFTLSKEGLHAILERFLDRMAYGLRNDGQDMAMIPSFGTYSSGIQKHTDTTQ